MVVSSVSIITVPVKDLDRAIKFYQEALGMQVKEDETFTVGGECPDTPSEMMGKEGRWVELGPASAASGTTRIGMCSITSPKQDIPPGKLNDVLFLDTETLEADYEELNEKGFEVTKPQPMPGGLFCSVKDPDGNRIWLHQAGSEKDPKLNTQLNKKKEQQPTAA